MLRIAGALLFGLYFILSQPLWFLGALVITAVTAPFDRRRALLHRYTCVWGGHYALLMPGWDVRVLGREHIAAGGVYVLCSNHQSHADTLVLLTLFRHFKWVAKASVFRVPFIGWNMALNRYIALRRGDAGSIAATLRTCRDNLDAGSSVFMFPEGTRSRDGRIHGFKHGAFSLAVEAGVPVVPVVLDGTSAALPKSSWRIGLERAGLPITVEVLPPVALAELESGAGAAELRLEVRARMLAALAARRGVPVAAVDGEAGRDLS
ncbi:lysophospholipid acyltransferase family protein [Nannocystis bainbridge]|uniref:1-acyl-sn-glycerol-3-phosphate acyltransferase n=1 Tax=Nannocystis bainbridge TaxID=2995303 RepID=A0ABT5E1E9_9BACT|nr:lysophospholipid acyltransferase family protein [Nannocystis bainbridge]MDC0719677.1 lysophospholipid acyltransferase family protein [Nannocystis bainbridge]